MNQQKIFRPFYRIRVAYWTTFRVLLSYLWLYIKSKFLGQKYYDDRVYDLHLKNADRVKETVLHLQGLFVKMGQSLSILSNFLPEGFHEPLEALQNKIPARPYSEIESRIKRELGNTPENLFADFDRNPLASASIGQVHRAKLKSGEEVVVKVQHANIESIAEVDLGIMQRIIGGVSYFFNIKGIEHAYTQIEKMIEEELDFKKEASAMQRIAANLEGEAQLVIPKVFEEYSTNRVLVTQFCEGVKINEIKQIDEWGIDKTDLGNRLIHAYCKMVFEDGLYHADPHPGNIMVQENGNVVFLDFGAIGELQPSMRTGFLGLIDAAVKNDDEKIIASLHTMGFLSDHKDAEKTAEKVIESFRYFLQNEVQFEGMNLKEIQVNPFENTLFNLAKDLGIRGITNTVQVPKEFVLLNRMLTLLLGICNTLDSNMNPIDELEPYFQKFILGENGNVVQFITELVKGSLLSSVALPGELNKTLKKIQRGELVVNMAAVETQNKLIYAVGQQLIFTILLITALIFAYILHKDGEEQFRLYALIFGGISFLLLLRSFWKHRK